MTVLVVGCGDLGTEAGLRFAAAGHRVVGWRRSPEKLPPDIEGTAADLTRPLPRLPDGTDVIVVTAAAGERSEAAYRAAYLDGVANVLAAVEREMAGGHRTVPPKLLFVSSTAVYGDSDGGWLDEDSPATPATATGRIILAAEELLHDRLPHAVVLRLAGIYGPGRTRLIDQVRSGTATLPQSTQYTNRIHRDDAAAAIVHLTTNVPAPAPTYIGVDSEPSGLDEVLLFLAGELRLPDPPPGDADRTRGGAKRLSNALLLSTGFQFRYLTFREGYRAVLAGQGRRHP